MEIGKPKRIHRVEPIKTPVPDKAVPAPPPEKEPATREAVTVK